MSPSERRVAVLAIGDELVSGARADANSSWIAAGLGRIGLEVDRIVVAADREDELVEVFSALCARGGLVICTGGLGPTLDDVTRSAAARAAGVELELSEPVLQGLRAWFAGRVRSMPAANERQAWFPGGARILPNENGTAPGFQLAVGDGELFALPGPPREMRPMLDAEVLPRLARERAGRTPLAFRRFRLLGLGESEFADRVGDWMRRDANPRMGVTSDCGVLSVMLRATGATPEEAERVVAERADAFQERLARWIFGRGDESPARALGRELIEHGTTLALAESCTGGQLAQMLTSVPGISAVFLEGFVTYSNRAKVERLGVAPDVLERCGAVSGEVAEAMALGAAQRSGARLALSVTGVAGPGGGSEEKPVGLVWFGLCADGTTRSRRRVFPPLDRDAVRRYAAHTACDLLLRAAHGRGPEPR